MLEGTHPSPESSSEQASPEEIALIDETANEAALLWAMQIVSRMACGRRGGITAARQHTLFLLEVAGKDHPTTSSLPAGSGLPLCPLEAGWP